MSSAVHPRPPRRVPAVLGVAAMLLVAGAGIAAWRYLHQFWIPQGDDYKFVTLNESPGITFTAGEWWRALGDDWMRRVGRLGDSVFRLIMRPGFDTWRWFAPVMLTALAWGASHWLADDRVVRRGGARAWRLRVFALVAGSLWLPAVLWTWPAMTGDAVFWADACVNYLVPLTLGMLVGGVYLRLWAGRSPGAGTLAWALPAGLLAQLMHEQTSWPLLGIAVATLVFRRGRLGRTGWVLCVAGVLGFVVQMSSPGLWTRLGTVDGGATGLDARVHKVAIATHFVVRHGSWQWGLLVLVLLGAALFARGIARWVSLAAALACGGLVGASWAWAVRTIPRDAGHKPVPPNMIFWQNLSLLAVVACLGLVAWALLLMVRAWGPAPLLAWVGFAGSLGPALLTGVNSPRAFLLPMLWLALVGLAAAVVGATRRRGAVAVAVPALVLAALAAASLAWWFPARDGLRTNRDFVALHVLPQFTDESARVDPNTILLPRPLPARDYGYSNAFLRPRYVRAWERYFGIEPGLRYRNVEASVLLERLANRPR